MPALMAVIGANADPMRRELQAVNRMANATGRNLNSAFNGHGVGRSGSMRETLVLMREIGRGNWTRVPGSLSILLGQLGILKLLFKDAAGEAEVLAQALAKKAAESALAARAAQEVVAANQAGLAAQTRTSAGTLLAVQADKEKAASALAVAEADRVKAVAARDAATAMEEEGTASKFALSPIGMLAVALIAVGTAAYFTIRHFTKLKEETQKLSDIMDVTSIKFSSMADATRDAAAAAQELDHWLKKLANSEDTFTASVEGGLEALKKRGATIAEQEKFLQSKKAGINLDKDTALVKSTDAAEHDAKLEAQIKDVKANAEEMDKAVTEIEKQRDLAFKGKNTGAIMGPLGKMLHVPGVGNSGNDFVFPSVNGLPSMSVAQAKAKADKLNKTLSDLETDQRSRKFAAQDAREALERDTRHVNEIDRMLARLEAGGPSRSRFVHGSVNSLQQIGAFAAPAVMVNDTKKIHLLEKIERNTSHLEKVGASSGFTRPHFG